MSQNAVGLKQQLTGSIPTLASDHASVDFLVQQSQLLWREPTFEKLLARFVEIQRDSFGIVAAELFAIKVNSSPIELTPVVTELKGVPGLSAEVKTAFETTVATLNLKAPEVRQGLNTLDCGGVKLCLALLGDPATEWQAFVWQLNDQQNSEVRRSADVYNDFFVRQLQSSCVWFNRLDKTQALLYRDDLTGVFNSRYLEIALENEIRRSQRFQTSFCLLFIDLDNFKMVNDKFGHLVGSSVLKQTSDALREASREVDSVIRYGGDEFVILLLGATAATGVLAGERMRRRVEATKFMLDDGNHVSLTASIGVAAYPDHATDRDTLLKLADEMMYVSKRQGKNRVTLYKVAEKSQTVDESRSLNE